MKNKFYIRYARNNRTLHIRIGKYHALVSWEAGIIRHDDSGCDRWLWGRRLRRSWKMDIVDTYMIIGCAVCLPAAVAAYELGHPYIGTALCIASGACMLLAAQCWTSPDRGKENGTALGKDTGAIE